MYIKRNIALINLILLGITINSSSGFDPLSIGSVIVGGGASIGKYIYENSWCNFNECCNKKHIIADFPKLKKLFEKKVHGQHLAVNIIYEAITSHWDYSNAQKALAISLHGSTGVGKNYVTNFIKESLFAKAGDSKFVHHFTARIHFPLIAKVDEYKLDLYSWIKGNVTKCPYQLFIFDEVDKIPVGLFDILKPVIGYSNRVDRVDFRKSIFIFLSNTGGSTITNNVLKLKEHGKHRKQLTLLDFKQEISQGAFNEVGGFQFSSTIEDNLIDHYVPFLPLELSHIKLCIKDEFLNRGIEADDEAVQEVLQHINWGQDQNEMFALTGCRGVYAQVGAYAARHKD